MGDQPSKLECFLTELRRRHVVRVAIMYAAVAFVVLQLGEIILPAFSAEWALQYLVVFAVLGFPLVMVLAWVFDITPEGIRKTEAIDAPGDHIPGMPSAGVLPRTALLTITLLLVGGLGWWWIENTLEPPASAAPADGGPTVVPVAYDPDEPIRSLAVLPLDNFSDTGDQDYFAAGMHEALIARLSQLPTIRVVSRTSVARYSSSAKTIPEIAQELGVEGIVEGSVTRAGDEVRITVQLIHGASDTHVWTQSYTRDFSDVLALQSEVAEAIAWEIQGELSPEDRATLSSAGPGSDVPVANEEFMKARFEQSRRTMEGFQAAMGHYSEAVEADPNFAPAYAGLAGTELMMEMADPTDPAASLERARLIALKALEVDPDLAEALDILTLIDEHLSEEMGDPATQPTPPRPGSEVRIVRRRGQGAVGSEDFLMVIRLDSAVTAHVGEFRMDSTRIFESMTEAGQQLQAAWAGWAVRRPGAMANEPVRMIHAAQQLKTAGRTEEAIALLEKVCELDPEHQEAWEALELIYASQGDYETLLDMRHVWVEHARGDAESVARLEERMLADGAEGYWEWRLEELQGRTAEGQPVSSVYMAAAYAGTGADDEALDLLEDAFRRRDRRLTSLRTDPVWDPLRTDPRFASLVNRMRRPVSRPTRRPGL